MTDCSFDYKFNTWKFQAQTWGEHVVYRLFLTLRTIFVHNMFSPCFAKKKSFWQRFTCNNGGSTSATNNNRPRPVAGGQQRPSTGQQRPSAGQQRPSTGQSGNNRPLSGQSANNRPSSGQFGNNRPSAGISNSNQQVGSSVGGRPSNNGNGQLGSQRPSSGRPGNNRPSGGNNGSGSNSSQAFANQSFNGGVGQINHCTNKNKCSTNNGGSPASSCSNVWPDQTCFKKKGEGKCGNKRMKKFCKNTCGLC